MVVVLFTLLAHCPLGGSPPSPPIIIWRLILSYECLASAWLITETTACRIFHTPMPASISVQVLSSWALCMKNMYMSPITTSFRPENYGEAVTSGRSTLFSVEVLPLDWLVLPDALCRFRWLTH